MSKITMDELFDMNAERNELLCDLVELSHDYQGYDGTIGEFVKDNVEKFEGVFTDRDMFNKYKALRDVFFLEDLIDKIDERPTYIQHCYLFPDTYEGRVKMIQFFMELDHGYPIPEELIQYVNWIALCDEYVNNVDGLYLTKFGYLLVAEHTGE